MKVKLIDYNWGYYNGVGHSEKRMVGEGGVISIKGSSPRIDGDQWNYLVRYSDGSMERIFNINRVLYYGPKEIK